MITISDALANARLQAVSDHLDSGASSGSIQFWTGTRPAGGGATTGCTKLGEIALGEPAGVVTARVLTIVTPKSCLALADGVVSWARILNGAGAYAIDGDCTATGGGGDFELVNLHVYTGGTLTLTSAAMA